MKKLILSGGLMCAILSANAQGNSPFVYESQQSFEVSDTISNNKYYEAGYDAIPDESTSNDEVIYKLPGLPGDNPGTDTTVPIGEGTFVLLSLAAGYGLRRFVCLRKK